jgi:hypothetical protein
LGLKQENGDLRCQLRDNDKRRRSEDGGVGVCGEDGVVSPEPRECEDSSPGERLSRVDGGPGDQDALERNLETLDTGLENLENLEKLEEEIMTLEQRPNELVVERGSEDFSSPEETDSTKNEEIPEIYQSQETIGLSNP